MPTWLITGCSTGLGRYLAQEVLARGWNGVVTARDPAKVQDIVTSYPDTALAVALDVSNSGIIVNVSSIAGRGAAPGSGYYAATKFALEGMSDALRKEVGPLGIKVLVVEPGAFRTDFAGRSLLQSKNAIADYANTAGLRRKEKDDSHGKQPGDSARGAQVIIKAVEAADAPFRLLLGSDAVQYVRSQLETQLAEVDAWQKISVTTDFPV